MLKKSMDVVLVQMDIASLDPGKNLAHLQEMIEKVVSEGLADLIVFPELCNSGYVTNKERPDCGYWPCVSGTKQRPAYKAG